MAVTLPYEDMEFVPLDILTAQEQNQLVANIEYLAGLFPLGSPEIAENAILNTKINNGAVTEFKIADGAVTSSKINWGDMENSYLTDSNFDIGTSVTTKCVYNVQASGKYLVLADAAVNGISASHTTYVSIRRAAATITERYFGIPASQFGSISTSAIVTCTSGDAIAVGLRDTNGIPASSNTKVSCTVVRIG